MKGRFQEGEMEEGRIEHKYRLSETSKFAPLVIPLWHKLIVPSSSFLAIRQNLHNLKTYYRIGRVRGGEGEVTGRGNGRKKEWA